MTRASRLTQTLPFRTRDTHLRVSTGADDDGSGARLADEYDASRRGCARPSCTSFGVCLSKYAGSVGSETSSVLGADSWAGSEAVELYLSSAAGYVSARG